MPQVTTSDPNVFKKGDIIFALWMFGKADHVHSNKAVQALVGKPQMGYVAAVDMEKKTYDIRYCDNETEDGVPFEHVTERSSLHPKEKAAATRAANAEKKKAAEKAKLADTPASGASSEY